jgi:hypothetical protein
MFAKGSLAGQCTRTPEYFGMSISECSKFVTPPAKL